MTNLLVKKKLQMRRVRIPPTELIFVTNITNYIRGEKLSCLEILEKFWESLGNFGEILWNFENFCHNLRVFMWRKIEPKSTFVEKKMTNMRSDLLLNVWSDFNILFPTDLLDLLGLIGQPLQSREMRIGWEHFLYHIWVSFIVNWPCINKTIKGRHGLAIFTTINMEHCTIL